MELSKDTLNFYLNKVLEDHKDLFNSTSARIGRNNVLKNLVSIYQELEPMVRTFKFWQNYGLLDYGV